MARRHRVAPAQLFRWKKEFAPAAAGAATATATEEPAAPMNFVPAVLAPARLSPQGRDPLRAGSTGSVRDGIEIAFPNGCVLRVPKDIEESALARLIRRLRA